jgi:O-antigen biosynthesis protein WbqP
MYCSVGKRILDMTMALAALVLLFPVLTVTAIAIKLFDPGPVIFRQSRVGRDGVPFVFYKFRSMPVATGDVPSDKLGAIQIGPVGKFIRRTNIDELPQLFNILKGDMSIVGPRPPISSQTELVELRGRNGALTCRPGLTGLAQVSSFNGMSVVEKAAFDGQYAESVSFANDLRIVARTFVYVLKPPPVY